MIRKFINKLYNFIQWTKKWHFCHLLLVPVFLTTILTGDLIGIFFFIYLVMQLKFREAFLTFLYYHLLFYALVIYCITIPVTIMTIYFAIINFIKSKKPFIFNGFLLNNKYYNLIYIISLFNFFCFIIFRLLPSELLSKIFQ